MFRPLKTTHSLHSPLSKGKIMFETNLNSPRTKRSTSKLNETSSPRKHLYSSTLVCGDTSKNDISNDSRVLQSNKSNKENVFSRIYKSPTTINTTTRAGSKSIQSPNPTGRSLVKSQMMSKSNLLSPTTKSSFVKTKISTKPSVPTFGRNSINNKPIPKMTIIKQQTNTPGLHSVQIQEMQNKIKQLTVKLSRTTLDLVDIQNKLKQTLSQNQLLKQEFYRSQGQKMIRAINNKILMQSQKLILTERQSISKLNLSYEQRIIQLQQLCLKKDQNILLLQSQINEYKSQLQMISNKVQKLEQSNQQLRTQKKHQESIVQQLQKNKIILNQTIVIKEEDIVQLRKNYMSVSKMLQQEKAKSFQTNQHLMTMMTEADVKNQQQIQTLQTKIDNLIDFLKSYEELFECIEKYIEQDEKRKQKYGNGKQKTTHNLEKLLQKIKTEGKQFLKVKQNEVQKQLPKLPQPKLQEQEHKQLQQNDM